MRHSYRKKVFFIGVAVFILLILLHPDMHGRPSYDYIRTEDILGNLHSEVASNFSSSALTDCDYGDTIVDETILTPSLVDGDLIVGHMIREGGEYAPHNCKAKFSTAVIVPFRYAMGNLTLKKLCTNIQFHLMRVCTRHP